MRKPVAIRRMRCSTRTPPDIAMRAKSRADSLLQRGLRQYQDVVHDALVEPAAGPTSEASRLELPAERRRQTQATHQRGGPTKIIRAILPGAVGALLSMSAAAQGLIASDQPAFVAGPPMEPTMMRIDPYPDEMYTLSAPAVPSCYRIGRCSLDDLYRFRDRPNRLTRLAPEAPPESVASTASVRHMWFLVPVTPEENILPEYRTASQVRDEYRAVGRPIDGLD